MSLSFDFISYVKFIFNLELNFQVLSKVSCKVKVI